MADEQTKKCLSDWGFDDLTNEFAEQQITYDTLKLLSTDLIKELIPVIGKRIDFINKWKKAFDTTFKTNQSTVINDPGPSTSTDNTINCNESLFQSTANSEGESIKSSTQSNDENIGRKRTFTGESEYRKRTKKLDGDYLDDLLKNRSNLADPLLADYKLNDNKLSNKSSFMLCDCICNDLVVDKHSKFTTQDYIDLTDQIIKWFPTENSTTYFRPGIPKNLSKDSKSKKPGGRLYDKIKNRKSLFARLSGTVRHKGFPPNIVDESEPLAEDVVESLVWLDHNRDFSQIDNHWKITVKARHDSLLNTSGNVFNYLRKYPVLKDPNHGHRLINIDFDQLYTTSASKFYENWESFITKIFEFTIRKKKNHTREVQELLNIIDDEDSDLYAKNFAQILLLPFAVPPRAGVSVANKDYWKPTTLESQRGFVVHAKNAGDIDRIHEEKVIEMSKKNTTVQPYLIGIGNTLRDVDNFIVVLDKPLYNFDSPLTALVTCFKIFYVWNVHFPLQSKQIWTLLQHGIFKFQTDTDESITHINKLLEFINTENEIQL